MWLWLGWGIDASKGGRDVPGTEVLIGVFGVWVRGGLLQYKPENRPFDALCARSGAHFYGYIWKKL